MQTKKKTVRRTVWQSMTYVLLAFMSLIAIFPAIWMVSTAIKNTTELFDTPPEIIPDSPTFQNFIKALSNTNMYTAFFNSIVITLSVVLLTLLISSLASYGLSFFKVKGGGVFKVAMLLGQMVPSVVLIIPLYFMFAKFHMLDNRGSLIIADLALTIPMGIVTLSSFFDTVPRELVEAAEIDGDTRFGALFHVVLPVVKPGLVTVAIFTFINTWEEFLFALNLGLSANTRTLPIAISTFSGEFAVDWGTTMAAATVVALPVLLLFLLCNKYFIKGLTDGAVKG